MYLTVRRDIRHMVLEIQKVQRGLDMLEKDHEAWARQCQQEDLKQLTGFLKRLESDVSIIQSDCMSLSLKYQEDGTWTILDSLHRAFATLKDLFNDLKKVRRELDESYIHPEGLRQLEIDWGRFRKVIGQILKYLRNGETSLNSKDFSPQEKLKGGIKHETE